MLPLARSLARPSSHRPRRGHSAHPLAGPLSPARSCCRSSPSALPNPDAAKHPPPTPTTVLMVQSGSGVGRRLMPPAPLSQGLRARCAHPSAFPTRAHRRPRSPPRSLASAALGAAGSSRTVGCLGLCFRWWRHTPRRPLTVATALSTARPPHDVPRTMRRGCPQSRARALGRAGDASSAWMFLEVSVPLAELPSAEPEKELPLPGGRYTARSLLATPSAVLLRTARMQHRAPPVPAAYAQTRGQGEARPTDARCPSAVGRKQRSGVWDSFEGGAGWTIEKSPSGAWPAPSPSSACCAGAAAHRGPPRPVARVRRRLLHFALRAPLRPRASAQIPPAFPGRDPPANMPGWSGMGRAGSPPPARGRAATAYTGSRPWQ